MLYDVSVLLSVRLSVTEVHSRIIANLGFKFRSHFTAHCGRRAARRALAGGSSRAMLASARLCSLMIAWRKIISGTAGPIFAIFEPNDRYWFVDDRFGPFFLIPQETLPWQPIKVEKSAFFTDQSTLSRCHLETDCNIAIPISKD